MNDIEWERMPEYGIGYVSYGTVIGNATLVVGFDQAWPEYGWTASYKIAGETKFINDERGYPTRRLAQRELLKAVSTLTN